MKQKEIIYISSSTIFSGSANEIQVLNMCAAFQQNGYKTNLIINSKQKKINISKLNDFYGINLSKIKFKFIYYKRSKGLEFLIFSKALLFYIFNIKDFKKKYIIFSRNLYSAFFFGVILNYRIFFECHSLENGIRNTLQNKILNKNNINFICITNALKKILLDQIAINKKNLANISILSDCSVVNNNILSYQEKLKTRKNLFIKNTNITHKNLIGYFGSLHPCRGIELILNIAKLSNKYTYVIFGGDSKSISNIKDKNHIPKNIIFMGYVSPSQSKYYMTLMDVLLMPYQEKVSIGVKNVDTSKWMSPLKMFEYMSSGVPIISSNLEPLKEILIHRVNSLLTDYDDPLKWFKNIETLINDKKINLMISQNAFSDLNNKYTWNKRAKKICDLF